VITHSSGRRISARDRILDGETILPDHIERFAADVVSALGPMVIGR